MVMASVVPFGRFAFCEFWTVNVPLYFDASSRRGGLPLLRGLALAASTPEVNIMTRVKIVGTMVRRWSIHFAGVVVSITSLSFLVEKEKFCLLFLIKLLRYEVVNSKKLPPVKN